MTSDKLAVGRHSFEANGLKFIYSVSGEGPLIVVQPPGWGPGSLYLQNGLARLKKSFKFLFLEPRGSGLSSRPDDENAMSCSHMADDLENLRNHLGVETITVLGHSNGACIALAFAQRYPYSADRLILISLQLEGMSQLEGQHKVLEQRKNDKGFQEALARIQKIQESPPENDDQFGALLNSILPMYLFDYEQSIPKFEKQWTNSPNIWAYRTSLAAEQQFPMDQVSDLPEVMAKTLLIHGQQDFHCVVLNSQTAHAAIEDSELVLYENCAHFPWVEKDDEFFKDVEQFLNS